MYDGCLGPGHQDIATKSHEMQDMIWVNMVKNCIYFFKCSHIPQSQAQIVVH